MFGKPVKFTFGKKPSNVPTSEERWYQELVNSSSMQHGLHPEDELSVIDQLNGVQTPQEHNEFPAIGIAKKPEDTPHTELSDDQVTSILQYESNGRCCRGISTEGLLRKFREINEERIAASASNDQDHLTYLKNREANIFDIIGYKN